MSNPVIQVENLSKYYRLGLIGGGTLNEDISRWVAKIRGKPDPLLMLGEEGFGNREDGQIWALKDVNLEVNEGEILGIIGRNGAGKSTLLKILSKITAPTEGKIKIKGRVGSLLEVGTGFHPELTGRENIYLNGTILGMSHTEVSSKLEEIVEFAGMGKFIDTPVKRYSSGMRVRLAFAVAAHLEPEILIIDEVLAVGDAAFQKKCLGKMKDVAGHGRTILFVSHNMISIQTLCSRAVLMEQGRIINEGATERIIDSYLQKATDGRNNLVRCWDDNSALANTKLSLKKVAIVVEDGTTLSNIYTDTEFKVSIDFHNIDKPRRLNVGLHFVDRLGVVAFTSGTGHHQNLQNRIVNPGLIRATCDVPGNFLNEGIYSLRLLITEDGGQVILSLDEALTFSVHPIARVVGTYMGKRPGLVAPLLPWNVEEIALNNSIL